MSFGKCKRRLKSLINRRDLTDDLTADFITSAVADLERVLRIGAMETVLPQSDWDGTRNALIIPPGFLEGINLFTDQGELIQCDMSAFLQMPAEGAKPTHYAKVADRWLLRPTPPQGTVVYLHCYMQSLPLQADDDENVWTQSALNAVVYTAASLAADHFQMEDAYAARFGTKAEGYVNAIREQDLDEKWAGRLSVPLPNEQRDY